MVGGRNADKIVMGLMTDSTTDGASLHAPHIKRHTPPVPPLSERVIVPVAAAIAAALLAEEPFEAVVLTMLAFACAAFVVPERSSWANLLPLMRAILACVRPQMQGS